MFADHRIFCLGLGEGEIVLTIMFAECERSSRIYTRIF